MRSPAVNSASGPKRADEVAHVVGPVRRVERHGRGGSERERRGFGLGGLLGGQKARPRHQVEHLLLPRLGRLGVLQGVEGRGVLRQPG